MKIHNTQISSYLINLATLSNDLSLTNYEFENMWLWTGELHKQQKHGECNSVHRIKIYTKHKHKWCTAFMSYWTTAHRKKIETRLIRIWYSATLKAKMILTKITKRLVLTLEQRYREPNLSISGVYVLQHVWDDVTFSYYLLFLYCQKKCMACKQCAKKEEEQPVLIYSTW